MHASRPPRRVTRPSCTPEEDSAAQIALEGRVISASESSAESRSTSGRYALKDNDQFLVADAFGDLTAASDGLFRDDTRVLSRFALTVGSHAPSLLRSGVSEDNVYFRAHATNRPLPELGGSVTPQGVIHIERTRFLWASRLYERVTLSNYGSMLVPLPLRFAFGADFADVLHVISAQHRFNNLLEVRTVDYIDLRCHFQWHAGARGDLDRAIGPFLGGEATHEQQPVP